MIYVTDPRGNRHNFSSATRVSRPPFHRGNSMKTDLSYFRRRASEERTAALQARDPRVLRVHLEFAERYESRVRGMAVHLAHRLPQFARTS